jgi:hypothetical protein
MLYTIAAKEKQDQTAREFSEEEGRKEKDYKYIISRFKTDPFDSSPLFPGRLSACG